MALIGKVSSSNRGIPGQTHSMAINATELYRFGDERDMQHTSLNIQLQSSCGTFLLSPNSTVLVLHNSLNNMLFDGDSVLLNLVSDNDKLQELKAKIEKSFNYIKDSKSNCHDNVE